MDNLCSANRLISDLSLKSETLKLLNMDLTLSIESSFGTTIR